MNLDARAFGDNEIKVLRTGEIADAGVSDAGRFVSCDDVVPYTHPSLLFPSLLLRTLHKHTHTHTLVLC